MFLCLFSSFSQWEELGLNKVWDHTFSDCGETIFIYFICSTFRHMMLFQKSQRHHQHPLLNKWQRQQHVRKKNRELLLALIFHPLVNKSIGISFTVAWRHMSVMVPDITGILLFIQQLLWANDKGNIKTPHYVTLSGKSNGDHWIPFNNSK